jgi:predicted small secreted protein
MRRLIIAFLLLSALVAGCNNDAPVAPSKESEIPTVDTSELERLERIASQPDGGVAILTRGVRTVFVPAGSSDALAAAINDAGRGGVVVLKAGSHTESATIPVDMPVTILGEKGAQLISSAGEFDITMIPVFWVRADRVSITGLDMSSASGDGNVAVLIHGADDVLVFNNRMTGFQASIVVERGNRARLWSNTMVGTGKDTNLVVINGSHASVLKNDSSNGVFGIWPCGSNGVLAFNNAHGNFVGIIFCKVPAEGAILPDGTPTGSDFASNHWLATENTTNDNLTNGFLSIDDANHNFIVSNSSSGNGTYDIELAGDSFRFGFLTPSSHDETFIAGRYATVEIKNCGTNNSVTGGNLVDNNLEPCD